MLVVALDEGEGWGDGFLGWGVGEGHCFEDTVGAHGGT